VVLSLLRLQKHPDLSGTSMKRAQKDELRERIDTLGVHEHYQLFQVIKKYTDAYTKTNGGIFVSSEALPQECLDEMNTLVSFYVDQRKAMDADEFKRTALAKTNKTHPTKE
jgi:hypothetical protein